MSLGSKTRCPSRAHELMNVPALRSIYEGVATTRMRSPRPFLGLAAHARVALDPIRKATLERRRWCGFPISAPGRLRSPPAWLALQPHWIRAFCNGHHHDSTDAGSSRESCVLGHAQREPKLHGVRISSLFTVNRV